MTGNNQVLTRADLATMTPEQINEARRNGDLNHLLTNTPNEGN